MESKKLKSEVVTTKTTTRTNVSLIKMVYSGLTGTKAIEKEFKMALQDYVLVKPTEYEKTTARCCYNNNSMCLKYTSGRNPKIALDVGTAGATGKGHVAQEVAAPTLRSDVSRRLPPLQLGAGRALLFDANRGHLA